MAAETYAKIQQQCRWWELFARTVSLGSIMIFSIVWLLYKDLAETLMITGLSAVCITLALWWYWAVSSIAHLAHSNWLMHEKMKDIHHELTSARDELQQIKLGLK